MSTDRFWILIARKLSRESSVEEIRELEELLRIHPNLHFSVEIITNLWNQHAKTNQKLLKDSYATHVERMKSVGISFPPEINKEETEVPYLLQGSRKNRLIRKLAVVSTILVLLITALYFFLQSQRPALSTDPVSGVAAVTTQYGSRIDMQLPDGSKVWLNSGSTITYDKQFGKDIREVVLSGEAYFDVVRNPEKPFIIHTTSMDIKVLGTKFNVKSYANDSRSEASLIHGSIEISLNKRGSEKILLKPNEKIVVMNETVAKNNATQVIKYTPTEPIFALQKIKYAEKDSSIIETSWVDNKLVFQNESFEEIAVRMERWFGIPLRFQDVSIRNERLTGSFTIETIEEALAALQISENFHYVKKDNTIIITK